MKLACTSRSGWKAQPYSTTSRSTSPGGKHGRCLPIGTRLSSRPMSEASGRWSVGLAGRAILACALGLLASCSDTSQVAPIGSASQAEPASQNQPTTNTSYITRSEVTWSVGVDERPAAPDDRLLYLAPTSPIDGVDTDAELYRADTGGIPEYSVAVRWPTGHLSVSGVPTPSCPGDRTWRPVKIRGVEGCEWTNGAGLYFLKWVEGTTTFHYSSFDITGREAREMLADWDPLE